MKIMLKKMLLPILGAGMMAPAAAWGQTVHVQDDMSGFSAPNNLDSLWSNPAPKGTHPENWAIWETDPDGTTANTSLWSRGSNFIRNTDNNWSPLAAGVSNAEPLVFQVDIYDFLDEGGGAAYAEIRHIHGASWQSTIFAVGVYGDGATHYRARAYPTQNWITLTTERSEGWHTFTVVIREDTFDVFVDQDPFNSESTPDANANNLPWDPHGSLEGEIAFESVQLGGAASTDAEAFLFDNAYLANEPGLAPAVEIIEQPTVDYPGQGAVKSFGESVTFDVLATGTEPLSYQWRVDGEPLANDARISGADTDTLTIMDLDEPDSGLYSVTIADANDNAVTSIGVRLWALREHEVIVNAMDVPAEDIIGNWGTYSETAGWFGWKAANTVEVTEPEALYTFRPTITETGWYEVWTYFVPSYSGPANNRTDEAPYHVNHSAGEDLVFINQQHPSGPSAAQWVSVGSYEFAEGTDGTVVLSNHKKGPSGSDALGSLVLADAVRFIPTDAPGADVAATVNITRGAGADVELIIVGTPTTTYAVEVSDDLVSWTSLGTADTNAEGVGDFIDADATSSFSRRFYRVTEQ